MKYTITHEQTVEFAMEISSLRTEIKMLREMNEQLKKALQHDWQLCPKCDGEGMVIDPLGMTTFPSMPCNLCCGAKIVSRETGLPPALTFSIS